MSEDTTGWKEVLEPKVWASRFPRSLDNVSFNWTCDGSKLDFKNAVQRTGNRITSGPIPTSLYFERETKIPPKILDAYKVFDSLLILSEPLKTIIAEVAGDCTQFFEVPVHADANGTPTDLPNHYIFNVFGTKDALIPELSENIHKHIHVGRGETEPRPGTKWSPKNLLDRVALDASALDGCDVWMDPEYPTTTLFFSDRLKRAIDAAGLKTHALDVYAARLFRRV